MPQETMLDRAVNGVETCCNDLSKKANQVVEQTEQSVKDNPVTSSLVTFGVGMGIGLLLTQLIPAPRRHRWYDDYVSDQRARSLADTIARRFGG
jgi:hypothetical protein